MSYDRLPSPSLPPRRQPQLAMTPPPEPPVAVVPPAAQCRQLPFYRFTAASSSSPPPWFPSSPSPTATTGPPPVTTSRAPTPTATAAAAQQAPPPGAGGGDAPSAAAEAVPEVEEEDRMDQLWEDFNEELVARGGSGSYRAHAAAAELQAHDRWSSESSDAESSSEPGAARGCAPVLRPSSRAGGAARSCSRRAGTWVLLMRIFRRLFVVEKAAARRHHAVAMC